MVAGRAGAEILQQGAKAVVKHTPVGQVAEEFAPGLYRLIMGADNVNNVKLRSKNHPDSFSPNFQGSIDSGQLESYVEELPQAWKTDFEGHVRVSDPDEVADFTDLLVRGSDGESDAKFSIMQAAKSLELERTAKGKRTKLEKLQQGSTALPETKNNFTVSEENLAPGIKEADIEPEISEAMRFQKKGEAIKGKPGEGGLSTLSTIGPLEGQEKGFNFNAEEKALTVPRAVVTGKGLGTKVKKVKGPSGRTRTDVLAEIERMPYKELHHIFGKSMGAKIIDNVWRLIKANKATVGDLINLNHWAKHYDIGMGDFGTEAVNRVSHSKTHTFSRNYGLEMLSEDIKAMPIFDDIDELTSYFRELLETKVRPMRGELDLQQGAYDLLPEKMRLDVEMLKVAKEDASRDLTQSYFEIYKKKMKDTPEPVKDAYQTHVWIQEELGVTNKSLIQKAKKLDQARLAQDQQMAQVNELIGSNIEDTVGVAKGKQIARDEQSEWVSETPTTRAGYEENYAANRIDPETTAERKMLEAGAPKTEAERLANIKRLKKDKATGKPAEKPEDMLYQDSKGKWNKRKTAKKQPKSKKK